VGLAPDERVPLPPETFPLFPLQEEGMTARQLAASEDAQLLYALDLLSGSGASAPDREDP
jgi:hypothetical protein